MIGDQKTISSLERKFAKGWILHSGSSVIGIFRFGGAKCFRSMAQYHAVSRNQRVVVTISKMKRANTGQVNTN